MQTQLWCARCGRFVEFELKLKKMRGKAQLAQLLSTCPKCRSTLQTQTLRLQTAEETLEKFEAMKGATEQEAVAPEETEPTQQGRAGEKAAPDKAEPEDVPPEKADPE